MTEEFDLTNASMSKLITHRVGNKSREEGINLSEQLSTVGADSDAYLMKYFMQLFKATEVYAFSAAGVLMDNPIYRLASAIFEQPEGFIDLSKELAGLLYDASIHPKINDGKLNVVYFEDILVEDELVNAIGLFKSENDVAFIKMLGKQKHFDLHHDFGFQIKGVDKGCLILDRNKEEGFDVFVIDRHNKMQDAQYWVHQFLHVLPVSNEYNNTNQVLRYTKNFVVDELQGEIEKKEEIALLSKTMDYFKTNERFEQASFENKVLQDARLIDAFKQYGDLSEEGYLQDEFDISRKAVARQSKQFRSVLKLDKNFHVYIHGGNDLIEKGVDERGRKYYKIYYEEER